MLKWMFTYARNMWLRLKRLTETAAPQSDPNHRPPRRARCGLSLFEAVLVMMIAVPMIQQGVRLAESYIRQQAGVQESRLLTQVVTAASTYALRDLNDRITTRGGGTIQVLTLANLAASSAWASTAARTSLGRDIQVIFYDTGLGKLVVLAHAFTLDGENTRPYMPRGGIGIGLVGTIREDADDRLVGPGLDYDLGPLQAQATTQGISHPPVAGDQLAIAVLRMDQDVLPYLHREAVPDRPELNQMQTDLDMGGFDLKVAGKVDAKQVISNRIIAERLEAKEIITGSCTGCGKRPPNTEGKTNP